MKYQLGEVILERDFETRDNDGHVGQAKLRIGKPLLQPETSSSLHWYCPYQIVGVGSESVHGMSGIDALDALLTTLKVANALLKDYAHMDGKKITWLGEDHLGLPEIEASDAESDGEHESFAGFEEIFEEFFGNFGRNK
jgi:hypothetical protein